MFKRPTARRKTERKEIELNLVPILDTMVTLISFVLFSMSFLSLVSIESLFPQTSARHVKEKIKERPLQLTLSLREKESEIWSPFRRIASQRIPHTAEGLPDVMAIHSALIGIKQKFPTEEQIVLVPPPKANYETLISVMDTVRLLEPTDPPLFRKNEQTGVDEAIKGLFPQVVFGNLLGDA